MKTSALILSFSFFLSGLLASAPRAEAEILAATVQGSELAGFLGYLDAQGFRLRRIVPLPAQQTMICVPCLTTPTGYTICASPTATPEAPFCHPAPASPALQVLYERG